MNATLKFTNRDQAKAFATWWATSTLTGHDMSKNSADGSVMVTVYGVTKELKARINTYVENINKRC